MILIGGVLSRYGDQRRADWLGHAEEDHHAWPAPTVCKASSTVPSAAGRYCDLLVARTSPAGPMPTSTCNCGHHRRSLRAERSNRRSSCRAGSSRFGSRATPRSHPRRWIGWRPRCCRCRPRTPPKGHRYPCHRWVKLASLPSGRNTVRLLLQLPAAIVFSSSISAARLSRSRPIVSTANLRPLCR